MSSTLLLIPIALFAGSLACLAPVLFKLLRSGKLEDLTPEWIENFSARSYEPMEHLLNAEDFNFLSRQPGFDLSLYRKLRRERLLIFRQYLSRLIGDFNRLHLAARVVLSQMPDDHSDLVSRLMWLKFGFFFAVVQAQISYAFCRLGYRSLAVRMMIVRLEQMSEQFHQLYALRAA